MVVTLAAARRLCAIHHGLEPTRHVHVQHLITSDKTVLLQGGGQRKPRRTDYFHLIDNQGKMIITLGLLSYQQLMVFWPFSVILCEA